MRKDGIKENGGRQNIKKEEGKMIEGGENKEGGKVKRKAKH